MDKDSPKLATSDVWAEQRVLVKFCVELRKTPGETRELINSSTKRPDVSRALVYKWHKRFRDGRCDTSDDSRSGRPPIITERSLSLVKNVIDDDRRLTVRDVTDCCDLSRTLCIKFSLKTSELIVYDKWVERQMKCVECNGDYFEKE